MNIILMNLRSLKKTMISTKLIFNGHYPAIRLIPASCQQKLRNVKRLRFLLWPMLEYNWDCFQGIKSEPPHRHSRPKFYAIWYAQLFPRYFSWKFSNADRSIYLLSGFLRSPTKTFNQPSITLQLLSLAASASTSTLTLLSKFWSYFLKRRMIL